MSEILQVTDAVKYYGNESVAVRALAGVSFSMQRGEFVAVMGPSGSGKSTLLSVISTIEPLSGGRIVIAGDAITELKDKQLSAFRRDRIGFIFQEYNLLDTLTVEENIALPLNLRKTDPTHIACEVRRVSEALGVTDQLGKFPRELSGGQRQRVACARAVITSPAARALITRPAVLLADEPTGALDSAGARALMELFCMMNEKLGVSILMVTHNAAVASYADRVIFLSDGKIFDEIYRGERDRKDFRHEIVTVTEALGGEEG